jgi:hypothetical protein
MIRLGGGHVSIAVSTIPCTRRGRLTCVYHVGTVFKRRPMSVSSGVLDVLASVAICLCRGSPVR